MNRQYRILLWFVFSFVTLQVFGEVLLSMDYPWKLSVLEPYLLRGKQDAWVHNAFEIQRLKKLAKTDKEIKLIVYLGGSVCASGITSDEKVSKQLSTALKKSVVFSRLCSPYKSFADELKIVEELGAINATIIINTEIGRFSRPNEKQLVTRKDKSKYSYNKYFYIPVTESIKTIFKEYNISIELNQHFRLWKTAKALGISIRKRFVKRKKLTYHYNGYVSGTPVNEDHKTEIEARLTESKGKWGQTQEFQVNFSLLKMAIEKAQLNQNRVILVETPVNPLFVKYTEANRSEYESILNQIIKSQGLGYLDLRYALNWKPEEFRDLHHMIHPGPDRFTAILAKRLSEILLNMDLHK
ncbi:MAG: D-alanyl-lipoteichoic acid biosynthesis protein DltD [Leptospirales bacterium]